MSAELARLIVAQICLHSCMTAMRMAAPLWALRQGHSAIAVGMLLALFALTQVFLALPAGRYCLGSAGLQAAQHQPGEALPQPAEAGRQPDGSTHDLVLGHRQGVRCSVEIALGDEGAVGDRRNDAVGVAAAIALVGHDLADLVAVLRQGDNEGSDRRGLAHGGGHDREETRARGHDPNREQGDHSEKADQRDDDSPGHFSLTPP